MHPPDDVTLIPQKPEHADGLFSALSDPAIYEFLDTSPPQSVSEVRRRIAFVLRGSSQDGSETWLNWCVFHRQKIVGYTQATLHPDRSASIAYVLCPCVWGRGVAFQACRKTMTTLLTDHGVVRFTADTEIGNLRSRRLLKRLGFQETHRRDNDLFFDLSS